MKSFHNITRRCFSSLNPRQPHHKRFLSTPLTTEAISTDNINVLANLARSIERDSINTPVARTLLATLQERRHELSASQLTQLANVYFRCSPPDATDVFFLMDALAKNVPEMVLTDVSLVTKTAAKFNLVDRSLSEAIVDRLYTSFGRESAQVISSVVHSFGRSGVFLTEEYRRKLLLISLLHTGYCRKIPQAWRANYVYHALNGLIKFKDERWEDIMVTPEEMDALIQQVSTSATVPPGEKMSLKCLSSVKDTYNFNKSLQINSLTLLCDILTDIHNHDPSAIHNFDPTMLAGILASLSKMNFYHPTVIPLFVRHLTRDPETLDAQTAQQLLAVLTKFAPSEPGLQEFAHPDIVSGLANCLLVRGCTDMQAMSVLGGLALLNVQPKEDLLASMLRNLHTAKRLAVWDPVDRPSWGCFTKAQRKAAGLANQSGWSNGDWAETECVSTESAALDESVPSYPPPEMGSSPDMVLATGRLATPHAVQVLENLQIGLASRFEGQQLANLSDSFVKLGVWSEPAVSTILVSARVAAASRDLKGAPCVKMASALSQVRTLDWEVPPSVAMPLPLPVNITSMAKMKGGAPADVEVEMDETMVKWLDKCAQAQQAAEEIVSSSVATAAEKDIYFWKDTWRRTKIDELLTQGFGRHSSYILTANSYYQLANVRLMDALGVFSANQSEFAEINAGKFVNKKHPENFGEWYHAIHNRELADKYCMKKDGTYLGRVPGAKWGDQWILSHAPFGWLLKGPQTDLGWALGEGWTPTALPAPAFDEGEVGHKQQQGKKEEEVGTSSSLSSSDSDSHHEDDEEEEEGEDGESSEVDLDFVWNELLFEHDLTRHSKTLRVLQLMRAADPKAEGAEDAAAGAAESMGVDEVIKGIVAEIKPLLTKVDEKGDIIKGDEFLTHVASKKTGGVIELPGTGGSVYVDAQLLGHLRVDMLVLGPNHRQPHSEMPSKMFYMK